MAKTFLGIKIKSQTRKKGKFVQVKKQISKSTCKTANSNIKSHIWQKKIKSQTRKKAKLSK